MKKTGVILALIFSVIALPLIFKRSGKSSASRADDTVIVITPHNEAIRYEIENGFKEWYRAKTGRSISIDWRIPGSTGEILRYVDSVFINSFRLYWEKTLQKTWSQEIQMSFCNPALKPGLTPSHDEPLGLAARRAFLNSSIGCGIDILFGGGVIEHKKEASMGQLVPSGIFERHPEWFCDEVIPFKLAGDYLWDKQGRWIGSSLSSFGIVYNEDRVKDLGLPHAPEQWVDLTSPLLFKQIAMVDPVQSSVVIKCFEMILQQQMQGQKQALEVVHGSLTESLTHEALCKGWDIGLKIIQKIMANSRYFTDASTKTIWDVSAGNCTLGVVVDFYGRYQKEILKKRSGGHRLEFIMPKGGSTASPDPIAMFRGAPHPKESLAFFEYVLSEQGQDLIGFKLEVPHGPRRYPLSRTPIRKDFYTEAKKPFMLSPAMNPFVDTGDFDYQEAWTAPAFHSIRFLSKVAFMDTYKELSAAWQAIIKARAAGYVERANRAMSIFEDFHCIPYDWALGELKSLLREKNPLKEVELSTQLSRQFREQYKHAKQVAEGK